MYFLNTFASLPICIHIKKQKPWGKKSKKIARFLFPFVKDIIVALSVWKPASKKEKEATEKAAFYDSMSLCKVY